MNFDVRTRKGVVQRIVFVTLVCTVPAVLLSVASVGFLVGFDMERSMPAADAFLIGVAASVAVPVLVAPIVSYRASMLMREAMLARDAFEKLSRTDQLTGLANRRGFDEEAAAILFGSTGRAAALMIDLDGFKLINDRHGHDVGDAVLVAVAAIMRSEVGARSAAIGRQGGDEFAILLSGADAAEAQALGERIRRACAAATVAGLKSGGIALSVGVAAHAPGESLAALMRRADAGLLASKASRGDRAAGPRIASL